MGVMSLQVQLERFEGPLALLLHLIREQEMDIFDINIAKITQQYLDFVRTMKTLDLEGAGDFVAMAATLLQIKSRMLLPNYNEAGEEVEPVDPRRELVHRLIEYQKFQEAAKLLRERVWMGRDVWSRGERVDFSAPPDDEVVLEENPLFSLISSYRKIVRAMRSGVHRVMGAMQSIASRILEMRARLIVGQKVEFSQLITAENESRPGQVLVTFLSLLELAKMGFVSLFQSDNFGQIQIDTRKAIDGDVVSQVESYENVHSERVAEQILAEAVNDVAPVLGSSPEANETFMAATDEEIEQEEEKIKLEVDKEVKPEVEVSWSEDLLAEFVGDPKSDENEEGLRVSEQEPTL